MIKYDAEDTVPSKPKPVATTAAEFSAIDRQITSDYIAAQQPVVQTTPVSSPPPAMTAAEFSAIDRQITADYTTALAALTVDDRKKSNALTTQQFEELAAPGAESRGLTTTYTPSTIVDSALALKLADAYGGQPSDYKGKNQAQLADIIGVTPTSAGVIMASGVIDQSATPSKARNIWESVTPWQEDKGQTFGNIVEDTFRETVSLGKIQTNLYNKEEIASDYTKLQTQQDMEWFAIGTEGKKDYLNSANDEYTKAASAALASGQMLTMTREQYLKESENDYDNWLKTNKPAPGTLSVLDDKGKTVTFTSQKEYADWLRKQQPTTGSLAKEFGLGLIPIVGTARNWDNMGNVGRGASILGDLLFVIPVIGWVGGAAVKTGATVAKTASISGRIGNIATSSARLTVDVAKGGGSLLKGVVTTPINFIRSPVATTKAGVAGLKDFGTSYVGSFKAGLQPTNIKAFGETLIGGKVYAPKLGGALVGGQSVKQIKQIEGTRPMTQGDVAAIAKSDISDVVSKTVIPPKESFSVSIYGNQPKERFGFKYIKQLNEDGVVKSSTWEKSFTSTNKPKIVENIELTYPAKPSDLIVENPNLLDSPVSSVMSQQTRKLTEQELLGGLDIIEPNLGGGRVGVSAPTKPATSTTTSTSTAPQKVQTIPDINLVPAIAISPSMPSYPVVTPVPTPIPITKPVPVISPIVTPSPVVSPAPSVFPMPIVNQSSLSTPTPITTPVLFVKDLPVIAPQPMPLPAVTPLLTPIPTVVTTNMGAPKLNPPPFLPIMPFSVRGGGGGSGDSGRPSLNSLVGQWQTKGLFVGITDPKTGKVLVGGIKGRTKLKYGNVPNTLKSRVAGGGDVASAGGRLIKRVNVV